MPLFEVQDADRPMFVIEADFQQAVKRWAENVAIENDITPAEVEPPWGVRYIADNDCLIIGKHVLNSPLAHDAMASISFKPPNFHLRFDPE